MFNNNRRKFLQLSHLLLLIFLTFLSSLLIFKVTNHIPVLDDGNLLIHEAGHMVFLPFGELISILGGTILQLLIPALFLIYFVLKSDFLGVSFSIFWIGDNFINVSYYISDAEIQALPLVGGGIHDWNQILTILGILQYSSTIGILVFSLGVSVLVLSLISIVIFNYSKKASDNNNWF